MSQRYDANKKRPKPKENQPRILKIYAFCQEIQQRALGLGESPGGVTHLWEYTQKVAASFPEKLPKLYLVVQGRVQLEHSSHIVNFGIGTTC